jgi:hypothetical protein
MSGINILVLLTPTATQVILENLLERIRLAFMNRSTEIDFPVEAVIEMALAGYLDSEAINFSPDLQSNST